MLKQVARNTAIGLAGNATGLALQFVASILIARGLGATGFGIYSSALAFAILFGTLSDGGVSGGLTRELVLAQGEAARRLLGAGLLIKVVTTVCAYGALVVAAQLAGLSGESLTVTLVMGLAYMCAFLGGQTALCVARARGRMEIDAALTVLYSLIFMLWVLLAPPTPLSFAWGWVAAYLAFAVVGLLLVFSRLIRPIWALDIALARQLWHVGLPLGLSSLLLLIYTRLPTYILIGWSDAGQVGLFNAAYGLPRNLQAIAMTLSAALGPAFVRLAAGERAQLRAAYTVALRVTLMLLLPAAVGGTVLSRPIILTLFGEAFAASAPVLALGSVSLLCYTLSFVAQALLAAQGRGAHWFTALGIGVLVNGATALLLVPQLGAVGASYAAVVADVLILALMLGWTRALIDGRKLLAALLRVGASAGGMALAAGALTHFGLWLSVAAGAVVYLGLLLLTGALLPGEIARAAALAPLPDALRRRLARTRPLDTP